VVVVVAVVVGAWGMFIAAVSLLAFGGGVSSNGERVVWQRQN